jgi:hypothetical protein
MASQINLSAQDVSISILGILDAGVSAQSVEEANRLLQLNHDKWHIFFRDVTGHNHIAHSILTCLALGAEPGDIQRAYDDGEATQRARPEIDEKIAEQLHNDEKLGEVIGTCNLYSTTLAFFQREIDKHGCKQVVIDFVFSRTPLAEKMLVKMYEGMYHSLIHLGLGVEFEQPGIIAEALAQATAHEDGHISKLLFASEALANTQEFPERPKSLMELVGEVRNNKIIYEAPRFEDRWNRMRNGVMDQASGELAPIAAQFRIRPQDLERRTAEMISVSAYIAGASQRPGRKRKIDFFLMHTLTSSIFFSVFIKQDWIKLEDRIRLVEWKGRLDLAFYAFCRCPDLYEEAITMYSDDYTKNMNWTELYAVVNKEHDDGHVAKFVRALRNGEGAVKPYEEGEWSGYFPVKGDMWVKMARMALDSTRDMHTDFKWIMGTGFDQAWARPDLK